MNFEKDNPFFCGEAEKAAFEKRFEYMNKKT